MARSVLLGCENAQAIEGLVKLGLVDYAKKEMKQVRVLEPVLKNGQEQPYMDTGTKVEFERVHFL